MRKFLGSDWGQAVLTQEEITKRLGISRERVGQIERRALRKLLKLINKDWKL